MISDWIESLGEAQRDHLFERIAEKVAAIDGSPDALACSGDDDATLALAVFMEYAESLGMCPLELHWVLHDPLRAAVAGAASLRVAQMLGDARDLCAGRRRQPPIGFAATRARVHGGRTPDPASSTPWSDRSVDRSRRPA